MLASPVACQPLTWSFSIENVNQIDSFDNDLTPLSTFGGVSPFFVSSDEKPDTSSRQSFVADGPSSGLPFGYAQELNAQSILPSNHFPWSSSWRSFQQANQVRRASASSGDSDPDRRGSVSSSCNGERRESYYQGSLGANDGWDDLEEDSEYTYEPPSLPLPSLPMFNRFSSLSLAIENEFSSSCSSCSSEGAGDEYANEEDQSEGEYDFDEDDDYPYRGRADELANRTAQDPLDGFIFRPYADSFSSESSQLSFSRFEIDYAQFSKTVPITVTAALDHSSFEPELDDPRQDLDDLEHNDDEDDEEDEEKDVRTPGVRDQQACCFFDRQLHKKGSLGVWKEGSVLNDSHPEVEVEVKVVEDV